MACHSHNKGNKRDRVATLIEQFDNPHSEDWTSEQELGHDSASTGVFPAEEANTLIDNLGTEAAG
jgi:predicted flavoprotein YhiN